MKKKHIVQSEQVWQTCRKGSRSSEMTPPRAYAFSSPSKNRRCSDPPAVGTSTARSLKRYRPYRRAFILISNWLKLRTGQSTKGLDLNPTSRHRPSVVTFLACLVYFCIIPWIKVQQFKTGLKWTTMVGAKERQLAEKQRSCHRIINCKAILLFDIMARRMSSIQADDPVQ